MSSWIKSLSWEDLQVQIFWSSPFLFFYEMTYRSTFTKCFVLEKNSIGPTRRLLFFLRTSALLLKTSLWGDLSLYHEKIRHSFLWKDRLAFYEKATRIPPGLQWKDLQHFYENSYSSSFRSPSRLRGQNHCLEKISRSSLRSRPCILGQDFLVFSPIRGPKTLQW